MKRQEQVKLKALLEACEEELLQLSLIQKTGNEKGRHHPFQSPIFRFLWVKLTRSLRDEAILSNERKG